MSDLDAGTVLLTGASLVMPDRVETATLVIEDGLVADIVSGPRQVGMAERRIDLAGHLIVPGFVDVHVHGVAGVDVLDAAESVGSVARWLPRWGVTSFCPTSIACHPETLHGFLDAVGRIRQAPDPDGARLLGAHLESNFLTPAYHGAQPLECLRAMTGERLDGSPGGPPAPFSGRDVLEVIDRHRADVAIVTLAPDIEGGTGLLRALVAAGLRVSLGHTGVAFDEATAAFADGARQVTHLFNRMTGLSAREPGLVGAALADDRVAVELICDGRHVHPASMRAAIAAKGPGLVMAITDGTAGSGLPAGSQARLGGRTITVQDVARLDDGTMAGSVLTMDRAFATLVTGCGVSLPDAARMCATTPARELGLVGHGVIAAGAVADLVVLSATYDVVQTWIAGRRVWDAGRPDEAA